MSGLINSARKISKVSNRKLKNYMPELAQIVLKESFCEKWPNERQPLLKTGILKSELAKRSFTAEKRPRKEAWATIFPK